MRLFAGIPVSEQIRTNIARFVESCRPVAPEARWVNPESLHITLKFIGEQPENAVPQIKDALSPTRVPPIDLTLRGYGFFRKRQSATSLWIGVEAPPGLRSLATAVSDQLYAIGIPKEQRPFLPHITLARGPRERHPRNRTTPQRGTFRRLQDALAASARPEFGTMTAREFFLYESRPSPSGSLYTKIARFELSA